MNRQAPEIRPRRPKSGQQSDRIGGVGIRAGDGALDELGPSIRARLEIPAGGLARRLAGKVPHSARS